MLNSSSSFCGDSPFWDEDLLLYSTYPDFTDCFRLTVLVYVPCGWLWLTGALHLHYCLRRLHRFHVPPSVLNITKIVLSILLAVLCVTGGVFVIRREGESNLPPAYYVAIGLQTSTYLFAAVLTKISRQALIVSPCVLFLFWFFSLLTGTFSFYSMMMDEAEHAHRSHFIVHCVAYGTLCLQFFLTCWAESSLLSFKELPEDKHPSPEVYASFPSKITFHWMTWVIYRGFRRPLTLEELGDLPPQLKGQAVIPKFQNRLAQYYRELTTRVSASGRNSGAVSRQQSTEEKQAKSGESSPTTEKTLLLPRQTGSAAGVHADKKRAKTVPLLKILLKTFYFELLYSNLLRLFGDCFQFANPALLGALIGYIETKESHPAWHGYLLVVGFFAVALVVSVCQNQNFYHSNNIGMKVKTALVASVYRKALHMTGESRRQYAMGAIVNFMSIDCQKMQTVTAQLWVMLSAPVQISLAFYFLYDKLGVSFLMGVAIIVVMIPINARVSIAARRSQASQLLLKDQRLKLMNELLGGIKVIKLSAWEESFQRRVTEIRNEEVRYLKQVAIYNTVSVFNWVCLPVLVTTGTLLIYSFVSETSLTPSVAFVSLSLFNILKTPMYNLPSCISELVQGHVSLKRLRDFLSCDELRPGDISSVTEEGVAISVKNATFTWDRNVLPALHRINLNIREGQLVAVVGAVGAGKSSLLCSFLGEMLRLKGTVAVKGSLAYVPQQAWIQNRSLKDCVIFDNPLDEKRYRKVIRACALKPDIEILPGGDATEIGEKGINLSGGQKLRVTLARAVYQDADIYLLDDPLSAVDSRVGKHIFKRVISSAGLLKTKTRVMVTHGVHWLPMCDFIIVMEEGRVIQTGTYTELLTYDGPFARYLKMYLREDTEDLDPEIQKILGQMYVRVESLTEDGMTSADEDNEFRLKKKSSRPKDRASVNGKESMSGRDAQGKQLVQEERTQIGKVKSYTIRSLLGAFGLVPAVAVIIFLILYNGMGIAANIWLSQWTSDEFLLNSTTVGTAEYRQETYKYVGIFAALGTVQAIFTFCFVGTIYVKMISASKHLHSNMLHTIMHQPMRFFDTNPLGRIMNRFSRDVDAVDGSMARLTRMFAQQVFAVLSVLIVISYSTPIFAAAALPMVFLYYLMQKFYIPCSRQLRRNESVSRSPIYTHFSETITGVTSIRAFNVTERFKAESERLVDNSNIYFYAFISASRWLRIRLELLGNLIVMFAALFAILAEDLSSSLVGLSVSYALQVTTALNVLVQNSTQLESNIVSVERLVEYITLPQEPAWVIKNSRPPRNWPDKGIVRFNKFSTRYRPGLDLVLHAVSCKLHSGEKVGIVGRTGAGKSTLSLSLFRLIEAAEGDITIDGVNIAEIGLKDLRSRLTILPQDPVLFSGTLRFNLDPLNYYSDDLIWSALEQAHLKSFVESLPGLLSHEVEEGGLNLSVGQRQLICLARALLRKTQVLVLDEATAAVDLETDDLIQKALRTAFKECTVLTIAHRLNTVMDYDKIVVLENGRIVEIDSPEILLQDRNSIFYRMAQQAQLVP